MNRQFCNFYSYRWLFFAPVCDFILGSWFLRHLHFSFQQFEHTEDHDSDSIFDSFEYFQYKSSNLTRITAMVLAIL